MTDFPLPFTVEVAQVVDSSDMFGNSTTGLGEYAPVRVAGWAVNRTEEEAGDSVLRTIDHLELHSPVLFEPASMIRLPDGTEWEVVGNAEDYRHGFHGWDPGLYVIHGKRVTG